MNSLLLKNVILNNIPSDIVITGNMITSIAPAQTLIKGAEVIDGQARLAAVPPFYNTHTHAAMTLLRGFADDLELFHWLNDYIWPAESKLTPEDIYAGTRLAILEMIKSGTVYFNDMYWHQTATLQAVEEMGVRSTLGLLYICSNDGNLLERNRLNNEALLEATKHVSARINIAHAPHAIYTVQERVLKEIAASNERECLTLHIHVAETKKEVADCLSAHGVTPVEYLDRLGLITPRTILAHCVHLNDKEREIIASRNATIAHMPVSNLKLCSGRFDWQTAKKAGCRITIGTDGASSNNNLSMFDEMKFAALTAKSVADDPTAGADLEIFAAATKIGAEAAGINAGEISVGKLADIMLVKLDDCAMVGDYHLRTNLVYSADREVVDTVICNGRILMRNRQVPGEAEIVAAARKVCDKLRSYRKK